MDINEFKELYSYMLFDPVIVTKLSRGKGEKLNNRMQLLWGDADEDIFYIAEMLMRDDADVGKALVFADYLTYVPFGELGYEAFDDMLRERGTTAADWRFDRFMFVLDGYSLSQDAIDVIRQFFFNYQNEELDRDSIVDITRATCRLAHNFETSALKEYWVEDDLPAAVDGLLGLIEDEELEDMRQVLQLTPKQLPLSEDQLTLLREIASED